jgi:predicted permease
MSILQQDFAYTMRRLARAKGFALAVIISISLGIAANATIFSMVSRFVLRPAPVGDPATLVNLHTLHDGDQCCNNFPQPVFEDVRDQAKSFSGVAAYDEMVPASIGGDGEPERVWGQATSANFFNVLELPMSVGRGFLPGEEKAQVIIISYPIWQRRFAADPNVAGKTVMLSGKPFTIVGVAPKGFRGVSMILVSEFWVPLGMVDALAPITDRNSRNMHWLQVAARLKPGVTREQTAAELKTIAQRLAVAYPATDKGNNFLFDEAGSLPMRDRRIILVFLGALSVIVLLVLCIACANVANLLLAQTVGRQREMAVRLALGATRNRILRQMIMESVLLAAGGGVAGTLLSLWATRALASFHFPAPVPLDLTLIVDWRALAYTFALSVGAGLVFGMIPAWAASHPRLANALKGEDALAKPGRKITLRNMLIVGQIATCLVLLTATGLFLRSLQSAANIDIGFRSNGIVSMQVDPRVHGYTSERAIQFLEQIRQNIAAQPSVISAVVSDSVPLNGGNRSDGFQAVVKPKASSGASGSIDSVELFMTTPGYFEALGIPRLLGRDFGHDNAGTPHVAIVNQAFVQKMFGSENPIGQSVDGDGVTYQIVGVVGNTKSRSIGENTRAVLYRPLDQAVIYDPAIMGYTVLVRSSADVSHTIALTRNQIRAIDPAMAVYNVQTMDEHVRDAYFLPRLAATLFGVFGAIGLILAAVGLYGIMSYSVNRRTREIGIRMALGAQTAAVQRLFVRQGMLLTLIAVAIGLPASFALAKLFTSVLYGVQNNDPATFAVVPVFLCAVALLACWLPARRAARVNPQVVLRSE